MKKLLIVFLPFAVSITFMSGLVYVVSQQNIRMSANDPQIGMAEDIALNIQEGKNLNTLIPETFVDPAQSTSPFIVVYNSEKKVVSTNMYKNVPPLPSGVFDNTFKGHEDKITWEPFKNLRIASVVLSYDKGANSDSGYVLVGRSLRDAESRETNLLRQVFVIWLITMILVFGIIWKIKRKV